MRLGLERKPLTFEDLLWPGQRIPRPRRSRRKGRVAPVQLVALARQGGQRVSGDQDTERKPVRN